MQATQPTAQHSEDLELLVKVTALMAGILPVVGAGVRAIAFYLAGVPSPLDMAVRQPVSALASTAFNASGLIAVFFAALIFAAHRGWHTRVFRSPSPTYVRPKWLKRLLIFEWIVIIGVPVITLPWPGGAVGMAGSVWAGWLLGGWSARHELTFYRSAAAVLVVGLSSAVSAGITGATVGDDVNNFTFAAPADLADGTYALVGESDGFVYLESCHQSGIVAVSQQDVEKFSHANPSKNQTTPSLIEIVFHGATPRIGYRAEC
jgi:hypothetical protein